MAKWMPWHRRPATLSLTGRIPVYCLPHAGGPASAFLPWTRADDQDGLTFVPVELPGHGTRLAEDLLLDMDQVVDQLLAALATRPADRPFILLGHSMGGQIAYETVRCLAQADAAPLCLVVSGTRPPGSPLAQRIHDLPPDEFLTWLTRIGGTPAEVLANREIMEQLVPILRADLTLFARYTDSVEAAALDCPVLALGGTDDPMADPSWIAGWKTMTTAWFESRIFPGDHFFLHEHAVHIRAEIAAFANRCR
ncbi:thioesterase II family protein [Plantactinospora soyae]|uniref:Surfactin synthase thioesterase subunit n=1 Tax=Plantactinospora soyae TaxID=1544732 RepID=A0A927M2C8_9ACTN|nr:alpha/beta fold hydrolase [Plantactinospora soyae]MBE1485555.1 surfactin synthase thioesterase subunit [Plantactinospora soyae]